MVKTPIFSGKSWSYGIIFYNKQERSGTMKYIISGHNIDVTEGIKSAVQASLKADKYFTNETEATVTLSVEKTDRRLK